MGPMEGSGLGGSSSHHHALRAFLVLFLGGSGFDFIFDFLPEDEDLAL